MTVIVSRMSRTPGLASLAWGRATASRLVRANIKSRFEKRKTNAVALVDDRDLDGLANGSERDRAQLEPWSMRRPLR